MSEQYLKFEISASVVAWYGAIVATISVLVSLYNALRDRARIKITFRRDMQIIGDQNRYNPNKTYFNITVTNKGRRPINIAKSAIRFIGRDRKYGILNDSFSNHRNRVLNESEPSTEFMLEQDEDYLSCAWYIAVYDATGKAYIKYIRIFPPVWKLLKPET